MSATTGTIQRPLAQGSILSAIAVGVATLLTAGAVAWGALTVTSSKPAAAPVAAPAFLDRGSRFETPHAAPAPKTNGQSSPRGMRAS